LSLTGGTLYHLLSFYIHPLLVRPLIANLLFSGPDCYSVWALWGLPCRHFDVTIGRRFPPDF
jgi:hypothetical protein